MGWPRDTGKCCYHCKGGIWLGLFYIRGQDPGIEGTWYAFLHRRCLQRFFGVHPEGWEICEATEFHERYLRALPLESED